MIFAVVGVGPVEVVSNGRFEDPHDDPVHIIHRGGIKQQAADEPTKVANFGLRCRSTGRGDRVACDHAAILSIKVKNASAVRMPRLLTGRARCRKQAQFC